MSTTHLWTLIQEWLDAQFFRVTQAQLADKLGVRRSALSQWKLGQARPTPENLRELHRVTRIDYSRLLEALVRDMGYLDAEEVVGNAKHPAPMTGAEGTSATGESTAAGPAGAVQGAGAGSGAPVGSEPTQQGIQWTATPPRRPQTKGRRARGHKGEGTSGERGTGDRR